MFGREKLIFGLQLWLTWSHQDMETEVKKKKKTIEDLIYPFLCYNVELPRVVSIHEFNTTNNRTTETILNPFLICKVSEKKVTSENGDSRKCRNRIYVGKPEGSSLLGGAQ